MEKIPKLWEKFNGGISDFQHESPIANSYYFGRSVDVRKEPHHIGVLPRTIRESGTVITDLPKWGETYQTTLDTYFYGDTGNLYSRSSARSYAFLRQVANSHGNGLCYSAEDNYLYYTSDSLIGRYGPLSASTKTFNDDFLGAQGGIPLNTNSLALVAASSQYAYRADTASLSITGDLTIEAQIKPSSLPTVGNSVAIFSKWDESGATRSYKFDIYTVSGSFGDASEGALTISSNTTEAPIDSACTGTSGTANLTATNVSFAANQVVLIHQSQGTGAGTWQRNIISSYSAGTIVLQSNLNANYTTGAQVRVLKQYSDVTINSGKTWTVKAWNGTVGGILSFLCTGTLTVTGSINANGGDSTAYSTDGVRSGRGTGGGFRGGNAYCSSGAKGTANQGEGTGGAGTYLNTANGNGGGGGGDAAANHAGGGGGGGNGGAGVAGGRESPGDGGGIAGNSSLTTMVFGGGGGGANDSYSSSVSGGASGGGIVFIYASNIAAITGSITANGGNAADANVDGGGGAGGSVLIKTITAVLGTNKITASGGTAYSTGGAGGTGRIHCDYYTSVTGTTSPTLDSAQDNNLSVNTAYQMRLGVSSNGSNSEYLVKEFSPVIGTWQQIGVTWDASEATAEFFFNAVSLGTRVGTYTGVHDNASKAAVGSSFNGAGTAVNFYDGLIDEVKVFNVLRTADDFFYGLQQQIATTTSGLVAYYKFNGDVNDATANANNLTASGSPTYSSDVPFPSPTTRLDIDQSASTSGNTYTLTTAINEGVTHRKTFTPAKDPQKSIAVYIASVGTGTWTLTVHDTYNNIVATKSVAYTSLNTGYYEFIFANTWSPLTNFTNEYHFHIYSTVADGTVRTTTTNDLETVDFRTYFQFLATNNDWHPIYRFLNFIVIGNGRYVAKYEAPLYEPNQLVLGAGWTVRCFALWQEYLAIGCMKGSNIYDNDQGRIYFWDGYSPTFNFFIDVPEGGINALLGTRGSLFIWAGYHADLLSYEGGSAAKKLKEVPLLDPSDYTEVYPGAVSMWMANPRYGLAGGSNSSDIQKGVYTWGSTNYRYEDILTYDYPISTGTLSGNGLKIGMILPVNQELLIGWQDNVSCGIDYVNVANNPYPTATIEMLIEDLDVPYKQKEAVLLVANFDSLSANNNVQVKYMNDETDTGFHVNPDSPTTGDTLTRMNISAGRYNHIRVGLDLTSSGATSPTVKSLVLMTDMLETEDVQG
jgi:hypothetical protein